MYQNLDLNFDQNLEDQAKHRLSALHFLSVQPLVCYKNIESNFELEIPNFFEEKPLSAIRVFDKTNTNGEKNPLSAIRVLDKTNVSNKTNTAIEENTQVVQKVSAKPSDKIQSLFKDLDKSRAEKSLELKELQSKRKPQILGEDLQTYPKLNLRIWTLGNRWVFISDDKFKNAMELANVEKLLRNIILALRLEIFITGSYEFALPHKMPNGVLQQLSWEDLARSLAIYLKGARFESLQPLSGVILFSDNNLEQVRSTLHKEFKIYLGAPSLTKLLKDSLQKQIFWQKILSENWQEKLDADSTQHPTNQ